jgi:hypothetical protein
LSAAAAPATVRERQPKGTTPMSEPIVLEIFSDYV